MFRRLLNYIVVIATLSVALSAFAAQQFGYFAPNETRPREALSIVAGAISGAYIGVGSERCFMMAALLPQLTDLYCVDIDPEIVQFNKINNLLLKIARNRVDYVELRLQAPLSQWLKAVHDAVALSAEERTLFTEETFDFWRLNARESHRFAFFNNARAEEYYNDPAVEYSGVHYLYIEEAYARVARLAKLGRIHNLSIDIGDYSAIKGLLKSIKKSGLNISVVDLSNSWWSQYAGPESLIQISELLLKFDFNQSRLLYTFWNSRQTQKRVWIYGGLEVQKLQSRENAQLFRQYISLLEFKTRVGTTSYDKVLNGFLASKCQNNLRP